MGRKKIEFSKKWLISCIAVSVTFTAASYVLAFFDKNPVSELSIVIVETLWGASGISFAGYAIQNSVRAFTASKFGLPYEQKKKKDEVQDDECRNIDTDDCGRDNSDYSDYLSCNKSEKEMPRMAKVRRIRSGKAARERNGSA
jgi:hypothetical protein